MTAASDPAEALALAAIVLSSGDAVIAKNLEGVVTAWNNGATSVYGHTEQEIVGHNVSVLFRPEDLAVESARHARVATGTPEVGYRCHRVRSDGHPVEVVMSMSPVHDAHGSVIGVASISRVVSDLELVDRRFAALMDAAPDPMIGVDPSGAIAFVNAQACAAFGYTREELLGAQVELLLPADVRSRHVRHRATFMDDPHLRPMGIGMELRARRRDGSTFPVEVSLSADGQDTGLITIAAVRDVTDRRATETRLRASEAGARAANEAENHFLARMSHELRTPLNAILGFGQILEHRLEDTEHSTHVSQVLRAGRHLLDLINEVLDIARIESGEMSISLEGVSVKAMLEESVHLMRPSADDAGVVLAIVPGAADGLVLADRQRLRQILLNLLSNAVKYNVRGGNVWLAWSDHDGHTTIEVRDDGIGIAAELQDRIFVPFDRLGAESTSVEGSGVGLTVTKALVELMHGTLWFASQPGTGTTFRVTLDSADPPDGLEPPSRSRSEERVVAEASATVLYVEDNEPNVQVMEAILEIRPEWRMVHAATGSLGVELARTLRPDLVLLDLHLPDGSGSDVLRALRSGIAPADVPIVMLSADASPNQVRRLLAEGADRYLTKPLVLQELLDLLDSIVSRAPAGSADPDA